MFNINTTFNDNCGKASPTISRDFIVVENLELSGQPSVLSSSKSSPSITELCNKLTGVKVHEMKRNHKLRYNEGKYGKLSFKKEILPYDQTRVRQESPINQVDYINATWIQNGHEDVYDDIYEYLANPKNR